MTDENPVSATLSAKWVGADDVPAQLINQALGQLGMPSDVDGLPEGIVLTFGAAQPPVIYGDEATQRAQLASYDGHLIVRPVSRVFMTRARAEEVLAVLQTAIFNYDNVAAQVAATREGAHHV